MRIALVCIVKNDTEAKEFKRMLKSFMPYVDGLYVAITGFGKITKVKQLVEDFKGKYVRTTPETHPKIYLKDENGWFFANFAEARNVSFSLVDDEYDYLAWADTDDVLLGGAQLKSIAQEAQRKGAMWVFFTYWYAVRQNEDGSIKDVIVEHVKQRLLSTKVKWEWISRLHEVIKPVEEGYTPPGMQVTFNPRPGGTQTVWCHLPPENHFEPNLKRNIRILREQVKEEDEKDPRTIFNLAKSYFNLGESKYAEAEDYLKRYLKMSGWAEERCSASQYLGQIYTARKDIDEAINWYHNAIKEHPVATLPYLWLAHLYDQKGWGEQAEHWLGVAMSLPAPEARSTIGEPLAIRQMAATLMYNKSLRQGNLKEAIEWRKKWNEIDERPNEGDELLEFLEQEEETNNAAQWLHNYAMYLKNKGHQQELIKVLDCAAPEFREEPFMQKLRNEFLPPTVWPDKSIAYIAASSFAPWNPKTLLEDGAGGSETAVYMLSTEWAKLGYTVTVYANVTEPCEHEGVTFKHYSSINAKDTFDTLIIWRNPLLLDQSWQAQRIFYDAHDVTSQTQFTVERMAKVDKVFFKSEYQRKMLPQLPDFKAVIISNGINV